MTFIRSGYFCACLLWLLGHSVGAQAANTRGTRTVDFERELEIRGLVAPPSLLILPLDSRTVYLQPTVRTLAKRLEATAKQKPYGESLKLKVSRVRVESEVSKIASSRVRSMLTQTRPSDKTATSFLEGLAKRVDLEEEVLSLDGRDLRWLDLERLSDRIRVSSSMPHIRHPDWLDAMSDESRREQLEVFFSDHWKHVEVVLESAALQKRGFADEDWIDEDDQVRHIKLLSLLPEHMQELYGRYSAFRGRNCFATALLFGDPDSVTSKSVNFIREAEHHHAMVNSDEFSEALWRGYRELSPEDEAQGLKFGDVIVLRDAALGEGYRSLLHAAVHVGGEYYFHKPSKSASSPIEFTNWTDMVSSWQRNAKSLTYRIYRKKPISSAQYTNPTALDLKIDWTP